MKLRIAYFCRDCDEEVNITNKVLRRCPHCGYTGGMFGRGVLYEWRVEVTPPFKRIKFKKNVMIGEFGEGASCPIEKTKIISKKRRKISDR